MGACNTNPKRPVKADASQAVKPVVNSAKNENVDPNIQNKPAIIEKPIGQLQQDLNNNINGIQKIKNLKFKIVTFDDPYFPNKYAVKSNPPSPSKGQSSSQVIIPSISFPAEDLLRDCMNKLINDPTKKLNKKYNIPKFRDQDLREKMNLKLEDIFKDDEENTVYEIKLVYSGLQKFPDNPQQFIIQNTNYYANINLNSENNCELVIFVKDASEEKSVKIQKFYNNIFDAEVNEGLNEHTTICNGLNYFYISGSGIKKFSKSFMRIKLDYNLQGSSINLHASQLIQNLAEMPEELQYHVMVFVPERYIFVVGGQSKTALASQNVYYYDIENNCWDFHSKLRNGRVEHSLCLVNDSYLYAFFGNKNNKVNDEKTIERINLRNPIDLPSDKEEGIFWESIVIDTFDISFFTLFGVGQYKNSIILLSVDENKDTAMIEDNNERNFIFNLDTNKLSLYSYDNIKLMKENKPLPPMTHSKNSQVDEKRLESYKFEFFERSFIPIAENIMILSPYNHIKEKTNLVIIKDGIAMNETFAYN